VIIGQRQLDQLIQPVVLKAAPPRGLDRIRGQACLRLIGEGVGHLQRRRLVIRPD
jgi:hypothetical protein